MIINLFSTIIPLISSFIVFLVGLLIFLSDRKSKTNLIFLFFTISVSIWLFGTHFLFSNCDNEAKAVFWDRFIYSGVVFIPSIIYHFSLSYSGKDKTNTIFVVSNYLLSLTFLFFLNRTDYFIYDLFRYKWGCHTVAGPFHSLFLIFFIILSFFTLYNIYKHLSTTTKMEERKRDMSLFFALLILYSIGSLAFLPAYKISIFPFPYIAAILTVLILAYGVIKHGLFNIRVITAELLTFAIWVFLFVRMLFSENLREWLINGSLLVLVIFFGVILIRSVLREVRQREKIQELSKYKSELLSIVAHQIKNPLVAIRGYTTLVKDKTISDAGMTGEVILKIKAAAGKLIDLLNNLLDLDHLEEGKMNYEFADIEMNKFLKEIVDDFQFAAKQKNLEISFEPLPPDIHIKGDSYKLSQVFRNLIDNAIKYTEKGRVRINIKTSDAQKFALITVSDSGLGMSSELIGKLFQKFSRRAGEKLVGSGLGLYISKEIVEAHNGKIWAESEGEGKGSGFYVKLPLAPSFK